MLVNVKQIIHFACLHNKHSVNGDIHQATLGGIPRWQYLRGFIPCNACCFYPGLQLQLQFA